MSDFKKLTKLLTEAVNKLEALNTTKPTLTEVLLEVHGKNYIYLLAKDKREQNELIRSQKVDSIRNIFDIRIKMGYEPTSKLFDELYSKDLHNLQMLEVEYTDLLFYTNHKKTYL